MANSSPGARFVQLFIGYHSFRVAACDLVKASALTFAVCEKPTIEIKSYSPIELDLQKSRTNSIDLAQMLDDENCNILV